jgi:hypothetical protein
MPCPYELEGVLKDSDSCHCMHIGQNGSTLDSNIFCCDSAFSNFMSPRTLSALSWICLILYMSLTVSTSQNTPRGTFLWYMEGFSWLFIAGHFLCSAYETGRTRPQSPRMKKALLIFVGFAVVMTLSDTTTKIVGERQRQAQKIAWDEVKRDQEKLSREIKQFDSRRPTRDELNRIQAQLKDIELRAKELTKG